MRDEAAAQLNAKTLRRAAQTVVLIVVAVAAGQIASFVADGRAVPASVLGQAAVFGGLNALTAIGIVLVYRANRVINLAHSGFGAVAGVLFFMLANFEGWSYYAALPAAIGAAATAGLVVEILVVRRFANAPRLLLTVVTIGLGQLLLGLANQIPRAWIDIEDEQQRAQVGGLVRSPLGRLKAEVFPVVFTGDHLAIVVAVLIATAALAFFLLRSDVGIAVRGASENHDRAQMLGINVRNLGTLVWTIAAALSGLAAVLVIPVSGLAPLDAAGVFGIGLLIRALAAAVFGRMQSLPTTAAAALGIACFEQSVFWITGSTIVVDGVLLGVILVGLLLQRKQIARSEESAGGTWSAAEEVRPTPGELIGLATVRRGKRWLWGTLAVAALAFPWVMSPSQTNLGSAYLIYGIIAVSLVVLTGWGGQISLGQFALVAIGALVGGAMTARLGLPFPLALLSGSLGGAVVAIVLGLPALRIRGLFLAVTTLAFSLAVSTVVLSERYFGWALPERVARPKLGWIDLEDERAFFYLMLVALIGTVLAVQSLRRSRTGRVLIALRDNERAAQSFGVNLVRTRLVTFALSGFVAAFAGVLFAAHQHAVSPTAFGPEQSINVFLMAVIGGLGSVSGVLLGALYFATVNVVLGDVVPIAVRQFLASGVGVLVVLLFFPGGLGSLAFRVRDAWLRRVALRHRVYVPSLVADRLAFEEARVALAPNTDLDGRAVEVPVRYRLPSRIRTAGRSQEEKVWTY